MSTPKRKPKPKQLKTVPTVVPEQALNRTDLTKLKVYDQDVVDESLKLGLVAQRAMLERLAAMDWSTQTAGDIAHALAFLSRAGGQLLRDASFAKGGPDSRSDLAIAAEAGKWMEGLTQEQFEQVCKWVEEGKKRQGVAFSRSRKWKTI